MKNPANQDNAKLIQLGDYIADAISLKGCTPYQFSQKFGISQASLSDLINGKHKPYDSTLKKIAVGLQKLGVDISFEELRKMRDSATVKASRNAITSGQEIADLAALAKLAAIAAQLQQQTSELVEAIELLRQQKKEAIKQMEKNEHDRNDT